MCPSLLPSDSVSSFLSVLLAGIKTVLKPPFVMAAVTLNESHPHPPHTPRRGHDIRDGTQLEAPRLPVEPSSSELHQLRCQCMTVRGCFHVLLRLCLQGSVSPLAEHRGVQVALTVPNPCPRLLSAVTRHPSLYWLAYVLLGRQASSHPGMAANQMTTDHFLKPMKSQPPPPLAELKLAQD